MPTVSGTVTDSSGNVTTWSQSWTVTTQPTSTVTVPGQSVEVSASTYTTEAADYGYKAKFVYWPGGEAHTFTNGLSSIPSDHMAYLSVAKDENLDATFASWQNTHTAKLYPMAQQEPEGNLTPLQWQNLARAVSAAAAPYSRIIPCLEFTAYAVFSGEIDTFYRSDLGIEHGSFSCYALLDANGIPKADPVAQINNAADWCAARGLTFGVAAAGYPLTAARIASTTRGADGMTHVERRIDWVRRAVATARARKSPAYPWFNSGDYRLQNDPAFAAYWRSEFQLT